MKQAPCSKCNDSNVKKYMYNGREIIVIKVKEDIGPCCTDDWAYYTRPQMPVKCCRFNSCNGPCGNRY